jgi:hypothetical protein
VRVAGPIAEEVGKLALMPNDSPTRYKGKAGTVKRVAWSEPIPLPEIKAVGKVLGCSVNDILLASVAGALRGYLLAKVIRWRPPRFAPWSRSIYAHRMTSRTLATALVW